MKKQYIKDFVNGGKETILGIRIGKSLLNMKSIDKLIVTAGLVAAAGYTFAKGIPFATLIPPTVSIGFLLGASDSAQKVSGKTDSLSKKLGAGIMYGFLAVGTLFSYSKVVDLIEVKSKETIKNTQSENYNPDTRETSQKLKESNVMLIDFNNKSVNNPQVEKMVKGFKEAQLKKGEMSPITRQMSPMKR